MDKQGALYFKLLTGIFVLALVGYGIGRICHRDPSYTLYSTRICEVGDGITVSGFVVRSESLIYCGEIPTFLHEEGRWVGGGQVLAHTASGSLLIPNGGYFSHGTDGYESLLTPEYILSCKKEHFESLSPENRPSHSVGKLIHGQTWYFAAPGDFPSLEQGSDVTLSIGNLKCKGKVLRTQELLVLECNHYTHCITNLRQTEAQIQSSSLSGIPLPAKTLYYKDGESCVYILRGAQAYRKTVRILRIQEDTLWIHPEDLPQGAQVILTDKEITDGMVLK